ncbi:MAG: hypothetical protein ACP5TV_07925 [Anaerolineae bacterium]
MHAERIGGKTRADTLPRLHAAVPSLSDGRPAVLRRAQEIVRRHVEALAQETDVLVLEPAGFSPQTADASLLLLQPGAGALLSVQHLLDLAELLRRHPNSRLSLPLADFTALGDENVPRSAGTCFAVEDGADLVAAGLHANCPIELLHLIESLQPYTANFTALLRVFTDRDAEAAVIGPIAPHTWRYLEDEVACRVRVYADGYGRHAGLAAELYRQVGLVRWRERLAGMADVIIIDTRQFLAGLSPYPMPEDFLASDLGRPAEVAHPLLRELTEAALEGAPSLVLGGPMLLNGGLYALVETAWRVGPDVDRGYHIRWQ